MSKKSIILCVDDEKMVLDSLRYQLSNELGEVFDFEFAESGEEALEIIEELQEEGIELPIIISDQIMPGMKGDELLTKVSEVSNFTKRILLTGQANADDIGNAVNNANLYRYIAKPWNATDLVMTIKEANISYKQKKELDEKTQRLACLVAELEKVNEGLNETVEKRTKEIRNQNSIIETKNKSIIDSINYAKRLQDALLTELVHFENIFSDYFVLFNPRDIVSGDFYWMTHVGEKVVISASDCSGHGVPGAIVSILGMKAFEDACFSKQLSSPDEILVSLHQYMRSTFKQDQKESMQDGMDLSICTYDKSTKILEFAGARNPLIYIQNDKEGHPELHIIKADRLSVGGHQHEEERVFCKHQLMIDRPTSFYMCTDGFADQFGGDLDKKYSPRRMRELFLANHQLPFAEQKEVLKQEFNTWKGSGLQIDDVLILGFKID